MANCFEQRILTLVMDAIDDYTSIESITDVDIDNIINSVWEQQSSNFALNTVNRNALRKKVIENLASVYLDHVPLSESMRRLFSYEEDGAVKFNLSGYLKFKRYTKEKVFNTILFRKNLSGKHVLNLSEPELGRSIKSLIKNLEKSLSSFQPNTINNEYRKTFNEKEEVGQIQYFDFILKMHAKQLIPAISEGFVVYDNVNDEFKIKQEHAHVMGWERKEDRTAMEDTSSALKILIESTPLFESKGLSYFKTTKTITLPMFYHAMSSLLEQYRLNYWNEYKSIIANPVKQISEIMKAVKDETLSLNLPKNVMDILYSIATRYFNDDLSDTAINLVTFYSDVNIKYGLNNNRLNYLDVLINGCLTYSRQNYLRYVEKVEDDRTIKQLQEIGAVTVPIIATQIAAALSDGNLTLYKEGQKIIIDQYTDLSDLYKYFKDKTGIDAELLDREDEVIKLFATLITDKRVFGNNPNIVSLANVYLDKNPHLIKSTLSRADGNKVPTFQINNLYRTFHQHLATLQNQLSEDGFSPLKRLWIYGNPNIYKQTLQRIDCTLLGASKSAKEFGVKEQLYATINYDWNSFWQNGTGSIITTPFVPSDKTSVGRVQFDLSQEIDGVLLGELNKDELKQKIAEHLEHIYTGYLLNSLNTIEDHLFNEPQYDLNVLQRIQKIDTVFLELWKNAGQMASKWSEINPDKPRKDQEQLFDELLMSEFDLYLSKEYDYKIIKNAAGKKVPVFNRMLYGRTLNWNERLSYQFERLQNKLEQADISFDQDVEVLEKQYLISTVLSTEYNLLTLGHLAAHKYKTLEPYSKELSELTYKDFLRAEKESFETMGKRGVALSATMHAYKKGILNGLPDKANYLSISDTIAPVCDVVNADQEMNVWDGVVFAPITTLWMADNSAVDFKIGGPVRKTLGHVLDPHKGAAYLNKSATNGITNAWIRMSNGSFSLLRCLKACYQSADFTHFNEHVDITKDFNGKPTYLRNVFKKPQESVKTVGITGVHDLSQFLYTYDETDEATGITTSGIVRLRDLWDVYNFFGAQYSGEIRNNEFVYSESSHSIIFDLLNNIGVKNSESDVVLTQNDVDQFLKSKMIHYLPTVSTNKSMQLPVIGNNNFDDNLDLDFETIYGAVVALDISNTGTQLDKDHAVDDSLISAPTQMYSFMAQKGLVTDVTTKVYQALANLTYSESNDFVKANEKQLYSIFGKGLLRSFVEKGVDVMGLAQALLTDIKTELNRNPGKSLADLNLKIPFDDENIHGKFISDVMVHINRFIKYKFPGSADVLHASYNINLFYSDNLGNTYSQYDVDEYPEILDTLQQLELNQESILPWEVMFDTHYIVKTKEGLYLDSNFKPHKELVYCVLENYNQYLTLNEIGLDLESIKIAYTKPNNLRGRTDYVYCRLVDGSIRKINIMSLAKRYVLANASSKDFDVLRRELNNIVLPAIAKKDVNTLNAHGGFIEFTDTWVQIPVVEIIKTEFIKPEIVKSYNYLSLMNINPNESLAEIKAKGVNYFEEKLRVLLEKYISPTDIQPLLILRNTLGQKLPVFDVLTKQLKSKILPINVDLDVTGQYRVDINGNELYSVEGLSFYTDEYGQELVVIDDDVALENLIKSGVYGAYTTSNLKSISKYKNVLKQLMLANETNIIDLAIKQHASFLQTLDYIDARIPAQSLQFATPARTVAFFPSQYNIMLVSKYITYWQGSDFDIDTGNNLGVALDKNGVYVKWSPLFDYKYLDLSSRLNWPNPNTQYNENGNCGAATFTDITDTLHNILADSSDKKKLLLELYVKLTNDPSNIYFVPRSIESFNLIDETIDESVLETMYEAYLNDINELFRKIIKDLNKHNTYMPFNQKLAISNFLKRSVESVYENIGTLGYATWLTTTEPIDEMAKYSQSKTEGLVQDFISETNPADIVQMIFNNTIGRNVIGIAASADKAECCIEYWLNTNPKYIPDEKTIKLTLSDKTVTINTGHVEKIDKKDFSETLILISSLLTRATDNAKNPLLNYINCNSKTAPAILWLFTVGCDRKDIVSIMTDATFKQILDVAEGNIFYKQDDINIKTAIERIQEEIKNQIKSLKKNSNKELLSELNNKLELLNAYDMIFSGAQELTMLAQALSINQGVPTEYGQITSKRLAFEQSIENALNYAEKSVHSLIMQIWNTYITGHEIETDDPNRIIFKKEKFFNDREYAETFMKMMQLVSITINPLECILNAPHFSAMERVALSGEQQAMVLSPKFSGVVGGLESVKQQRFDKELVVDKKQLPIKMRNRLNADMIVSFLEMTSFPYPNLEDGRVVVREIGNPIGFQNYHIFINDVLIPALKRKYLDNFFISNLRSDRSYNDYGYFYAYKPSMNLIENPEYSDTMLNDFNQIANVTVGEDILNDFVKTTRNWPLHTIGEYFFIYNLIVNQNALKGTSFNKMFTEIIKDSKIISGYFKYIASNSYNPINDYIRSDFNELSKTKEGNSYDDNYDDNDYDFHSDDEYSHNGPMQVEPINNARSRALSEKASTQIAFENLIEAAISNFKIILKQC